MRTFLLAFALLLVTGCSSKKLVAPKEVLVFGDEAVIVSGPYKNSRALIDNQIDDQYKSPCTVHQYHALVTRNGMSRYDYVCHEDLRVYE